MRRSQVLKSLVAVLSGLVMAAPASAGLVGDSVSCSIVPTPFWVCSSPTAVVGAGVEFTLIVPASSDFGLDVDLGDSSIRIGSNRSNTFGLGAGELLTLGSLDAGAPILGITNLMVSGVSVLSLASITTTADSVTINLNSGATWNVGSFVSFDLVTGPVSVPAPGTLALGGLALAALAWSRRRA